jgi:hypothetical protein
MNVSLPVVNCSHATKPEKGDGVLCDHPGIKLLRKRPGLGYCANCPLVNKIDGNKHTVDSALLKPLSPQPIKRTIPKGGAGTELKKLFASFGFTPSSNCQCNARSYQMDQAGPAWCEGHIDEIISWLAVEWKRSHSLLPFPAPLARLAVGMAIARAREKMSALAEPGNAGASPPAV